MILDLLHVLSTMIVTCFFLMCYVRRRRFVQRRKKFKNVEIKVFTFKNSAKGERIERMKKGCK
jgi:hypothetical protein